VEAQPNEPATDTGDEQSTVLSNGGGEVEREKELIQLEMMKWRIGVERIMASVRNLERQRATYVRRAEETGE
jgi:hypothetical protein